MKSVDELIAEAFGSPRDPRSDEYKAGVRAALEYRLNRRKLALPCPIGTAQADAWFSGLDEGHRIAAELREDVA